jgi:exonuclease SbcD
MKLLHTSDWHVGKTIRGISRADEHRAVLKEIAGIAEREEVDLIVVAGDLFETAAPTAESEQIVYDALLRLANTGAHVAVIAGNHDNAGRLHAVAPLLALGRVHLVAEPARPDDGGVRRLTARDGTEVRIALLPFVSKRGIVRSADLLEREAFEHAQAYSERMRLVLDALTADFERDTVNVLAAHAFVLGAEAGGGERAAHLVEEYAVTAQSFPPTIGYGALGHLHRPQRLPAGPALHYCGSPLQLDFGEGEQVKQVNVVTIEPGVPADVSAVRLTSGRPLRTVRGTLQQLEASSQRSAAPSLDLLHDEPWLRVIVEGPTRAGLAELVRELLGERVVEVRVDRPTITGGRRAADHRTRSPQELFDEYLAAEGVDDERVRQLFADLLDEEHEAASG